MGVSQVDTTFQLVPEFILTDAVVNELDVTLANRFSFSALMSQNPASRKNGTGYCLASRGQITALFPFVGFFDQMSPYRIQDDVSAQFQEACLLLHDDGIIPVLQNVGGLPVMFVEGDTGAAIESFHPSGQVGFPGFDEQVIVVGHEAISMAEPSVLLNGLPQDFQESGIIFFIVIAALLIVPPGGDVIYFARELRAERSCHIDTPFRPMAFGEEQNSCQKAILFYAGNQQGFRKIK